MNTVTASSVEPLIYELRLPLFLRMALEDGQKSEFRIELNSKNCRVHPGSFDGLDLESGRARRGYVPELRARCRFDSGNVRAVTVTPTIKRGDLIWVLGTSGGRRCTTVTLEVWCVDVARLQDMDDAAAIREGIDTVQTSRRATDLTPRDRFSYYWDRCSWSGSWRSNPWVWIVSFDVHRMNIDAFIASRNP